MSEPHCSWLFPDTSRNKKQQNRHTSRPGEPQPQRSPKPKTLFKLLLIKTQAQTDAAEIITRWRYSPFPKQQEDKGQKGSESHLSLHQIKILPLSDAVSRDPIRQCHASAVTHFSISENVFHQFSIQSQQCSHASHTSYISPSLREQNRLLHLQHTSTRKWQALPRQSSPHS